MAALIGLHGFTQTGRMFDELADRIPRDMVAPDLPGHGPSDQVPVEWESVVGLVDGLAGGEPPDLIGYSMGGRLAIRYALERPVSRLVLISTGPGIGDDAQRAKRREADGMLIERLRSGDLATFIDDWLGSPLFIGLNKRHEVWRSVDRAQRLTSSAEGLARSLERMGQGTFPYQGARLSKIHIPTLVVAGGLDAKYLAIAREMTDAMPNAQITVVADAGHAVIGERPDAVGRAITDFLY